MKTILSSFPRLETTRLDESARAAQPGSFIRLPRGFVHYELEGPEDGPLAVLVHGFSIPYYLWDPTSKALARAGFRVLRYDLFGRGYSDRPRGPYNLPFFSRQLSDLLDTLRIHRGFHLAGVSMGGPICLHFAADHPRAVKSVSLIDPAGFAPPGMFPPSLRVPGLGELMMQLQSRRRVIESLEIDLLNPGRFPGYMEQYLP